MSDADARMRKRERSEVRRAELDTKFQARLAEEITRGFPSCPAHRAIAIALMAGVTRDMARQRAQPVIDQVLAAWRTKSAGRH